MLSIDAALAWISGWFEHQVRSESVSRVSGGVPVELLLHPNVTAVNQQSVRSGRVMRCTTTN